MGAKPDRETPVRAQYLALKRQYPDAILFFRLGDFYETFDRDAELTASLLNITLTSREMGKGQRVPLAGVPYHSAETYIARLIAAGQKVAVCEQLDQPALKLPNKKPSSKMMEREVVRVVTPGTVVEPRMLQAQRNNYLCALVCAYQANGLPSYGLAYADVTTGEFATTELHGDEATADLSRELDRLSPAECVVPGTGGPGAERAQRAAPRGFGGAAPAGPPEGGHDSLGGLGERSVPQEPASPEESAVAGRSVAYLDPWRFTLETSQETLCRLFGVTSLAGYGCAHLPLATRAAGALVAYLETTHKQLLGLLEGLKTYEPGAFVRLDGFTRRNLELEESRASSKPTLYSVLDETKTPLGGRLLRRWLGQPLRDLDALRRRHDAVGALVGDGVLRGQLRGVLSRIADLERLTNRARQGISHPRDLLALRYTLLAAAELHALAQPDRSDAIHDLIARVDPCAEVADLVDRAVYDGGAEHNGATRALGSWDEERLIKPGYSAELDDLVRSSADARAWIAGLEALERERTGIKSLKVGFNKVFGYYLSVSHAFKGVVPSHYIRRQTLTDGERYITPELKEYENVVLHAAERIAELERTLFAQVQREIATYAERLLATAAALAQLDTLASFAEVAVRRGYVRPTLDDGETLEIDDGRHPVVEHALEMATAQVGQPQAFVPNGCRLSADGASSGQIIILTGPNMAGKSTYLRSVALICLMAQAGSFVPASRARIGLVDRIFTRVGAQDDLTAGQSTFMVEMVETASILRHATHKSLVILDEIGRGTSTYDGLAIAQAVVEHLHAERAGPRTLFATHYHELAELEGVLPRVRNCRMDVLEEGDRVVFLHRVAEGSAGRSYGIHVARLAGVPRAVTTRAQEILAALEDAAPPAPNTNGHVQLSLFLPDHPVLDELKSLDVLTLTPLQALNKLAELAEQVKLGARGPSERSERGPRRMS